MMKTLPKQVLSSIVLAFAVIALVSCKTTTTQEEPAPAAGAQEPASTSQPGTKLAAADAPVEPDQQPAPAAGQKPSEQNSQSATAPAEAPAAASQQVAAAPTAPEPPPPAVEKPTKTLSPDDPRSIIYLGSDGKIAGTGDPNAVVSDAFRYGQGASANALTAPGLPKDKFGLIDWIAMVDQAIIQPIGSLKPGAMDIPPFDMNVVIHAKGDFVNDVLFQHKTHTYWLSCEICHTGIFIMAKGKNNMTMQGITQGKWCGRCHGKVSFPLTDCTRCHSQPKDTSGTAAPQAATQN